MSNKIKAYRFHGAAVLGMWLASSFGCEEAAKPSMPVGVAEEATFTGSALIRPTEQYREWQYVSTGLGMSYATTMTGTETMFDNVFVQRSAYESFKTHGTWPEKTVFVLELQLSSNKGSILKQGTYQAGAVLIEAKVKDSSRFDSLWGYFSFYPSADGSLPEKAERNPDEACLSCHRDNAWVDTTFAQFYPTILPIAEKLGTVVNRPDGP